MHRCPVCAGGAAGDTWLCGRCLTPHHRECAEYFGGCAIFGCRDGAPPDPIERTSWPSVVRCLRAFVWLRAAQAGLAGMFVGALLVLVLLVPFNRPELLVDLMVGAGALGAIGFLAGFPVGEIALWALRRELGRERSAALELPRSRLQAALPYRSSRWNRVAAVVASTGLATIAAGVLAAWVSPLGVPVASELAVPLVSGGFIALLLGGLVFEYAYGLELFLCRFEATYGPRLLKASEPRSSEADASRG